MSTESPEVPEPVRFTDLGLSKSALKALEDIGYETPSPIQAETIPPLLKGKDVLGQAQTGTGKTAAFALPILCHVELAQKLPQALILVPTRELAIQVAEAFQKYASHMKGLHVLPIYGGTPYAGQLRALQRGVHVVVGTPGRVMDHMRRGTLNLENLSTLVLDEADEMLRMGFFEDVKWILEQSPSDRQIALFSATMPREVQRVAEAHMRNPEIIAIKVRTSTAETINQRYWMVSHHHKLDALTRILEAETFDAVLIFVRTKTATVELVEKLNARGYAASALNGDIAQNQRERTITRLRNGDLDILVATDVAARGLDVLRITHVINYDIPTDTEPYIHRIGRTGRAGRTGEAILFVTPREKRLLFAIEKATRQKISLLEMPSTEHINDKRIAQFKQKITDTLANKNLKLYEDIVEQYLAEHNVPAIEIAAALAQLAQGSEPLLLKDRPKPEKRQRDDRNSTWDPRERKNPRTPQRERGRKRENEPLAEGMERFRIEVGHKHGVKPGNIVGAIANEAGLESKFIGAIDIQEHHSVVVLPQMPKEIFELLQDVWVAGQPMRIKRDDSGDGPSPDKFFKRGRGNKGAPPRHGGKGKSFGGKPHGGKSFGGKPDGQGDKKRPELRKPKKGKKKHRKGNT